MGFIVDKVLPHAEDATAHDAEAYEEDADDDQGMLM